MNRRKFLVLIPATIVAGKVTSDPKGNPPYGDNPSGGRYAEFYEAQRADKAQAKLNNNYRKMVDHNKDEWHL